jgi:hypothetical protein
MEREPEGSTKCPTQSEHRIAIFGVNGPISIAPPNSIFVRHARLAFYPGLYQPVAADRDTEVNITVERFDPHIDKIIPKNPKLEALQTRRRI